jgi:hypothetical protein
MCARAGILTLMLVSFISFIGFAQTHTAQVQHPDRYRLDLPKEWKKSRLIDALTDILPQTIDELKDRDFCTEGKAAYSVKLAIDSLTVSNEQTTPPVEIGTIPHYTFSFNYNFMASLLVIDSTGRSVSMLQLVPGDETMTYQKQFSLAPQNIVYRYQTLYDQRGRAAGRRMVEDAGAVNNYVPRLSAFSVLTQEFLLRICEQKIYEIRKLLKKLNQN